jgi:hypothetical protein
LDLDIDQNTGEIRTKVVLDRELRNSYHLSAIPLSGDGENIKVHSSENVHKKRGTDFYKFGGFHF